MCPSPSLSLCPPLPLARTHSLSLSLFGQNIIIIIVNKYISNRRCTQHQWRLCNQINRLRTIVVRANWSTNQFDRVLHSNPTHKAPASKKKSELKFILLRWMGLRNMCTTTTCTTCRKTIEENEMKRKKNQISKVCVSLCSNKNHRQWQRTRHTEQRTIQFERNAKSKCVLNSI